MNSFEKKKKSFERLKLGVWCAADRGSSSTSAKKKKTKQLLMMIMSSVRN
jgi:hypothetical protein